MWPMIIFAIIQGVQQIAKNFTGNKATQAQMEQQRKQKIEVIRQMNYRDANLRMQQRGQFDQVVNELEDLSLNAIKNQSAVRTAMSESNLEGRSLDAVLRDVEGADARAASRLDENYARDYATIAGERYSNEVNSYAQIRGMPKIMKQHWIEQILLIGSSAAQGAAQGASYASGANTGSSGAATITQAQPASTAASRGSSAKVSSASGTGGWYGSIYGGR